MGIRKIIKTIRTKILFRGFGKIGSTSYIQKPLRIVNKSKIFIDEDVFIRKGARFEIVNDWFGHKFDGKLIIKKGTVIEQNCHIVACDELIIGEDCLISSNVFISDCSHQFRDIKTKVLLQDLIVSKTKIGNQTFIGHGACIMPGVIIGSHCVVGANSVVTKSIPDFSVVAGVPARIIKMYNSMANEWEVVN